MFSRTLKFLQHDIWQIRLADLSKVKSFFIRLLRVVVLAVRGFDEDKCKFRASALTFYSLLSIVPVVATMFAIAKGFGLEEHLKRRFASELTHGLQGQEEVAERIITFANNLLEGLLQKARGDIIAVFAVAFLFWTIIKLLSNIENSFNDIWGIKKPRSLGRKFSDYLSVMLICPILLALASSITVYVASKVRLATEEFALLKSVGPLVTVLLKLLPYCAVWLTFTFIFIFMPNTKVKFKSGLIGGIVAGTIFQAVEWAYINFQIGATMRSAVYGSFAALPLFILWLQISWLVLLFGTEVSFAHQNVDTYEFEQQCDSVSHSFKRLLSLLITHQIVKSFSEAQAAPDASGISRAFDIPIRLVRQIAYELVEAGVVSEIRQDSDKEPAYQPACDIDKLTVQYVVEKLENRGNSDIPVVKSPQLDKLSASFSEFSKCINGSSANVLLKNM